MVTLLRSSERKMRFNTGTPPFGLHPCLYYNVPTGLCLGYRGGVWADGKVTLLRSSIWNNTFYTGTPPYGLHPCLYYNVPTGLAFGLWGGVWMG